MNFIISGASGFIGRALVKHLHGAGHRVVALSRSPHRAAARFPRGVICRLWAGQDISAWQEELDNSDVVINLIGENISSGRWTAKRKQQLIDSRTRAGQSLVTAIQGSKNKPGLLIQASAIGYYGNSTAQAVDESTGQGSGFLAEVCHLWEQSVATLQDSETRVAIVRIGLVLDKNGGALKKMLLPFRLFSGGPLGSGKQHISWIHIEDLCRAIEFLAKNQQTRGIFNLTAPQVVTMSQFAKTLGRTLRRPAVLPVPAFVLKLLFGEMARETVLADQQVVPAALIKAGFTFIHPRLEDALGRIFK